MADPAQLRKCEELLGKLPEKQAPATGLLRNPVWVFLKDLEGFDNGRASECLVKLLNKHYDTIGVLKLATKQDLVEDAGILPGDALRIVVAVKDYVAPREPSREPTSQCDHASKTVQGVEHRQDAYRPPALRERTVIFTPPGASQSSSDTQFPPVMQHQQQKEVQVVNHCAAASQQEAVKEGKVVNQGATEQASVKDAKAPADPTLPLPKSLVDGRTGYAPADARFVPADPTLPLPWRALVDGKTGYTYYWNPVMNITQYDKPLPPVGSGPSLPSGPPPPGPPPSTVTSEPKSAAIPQTIPAGISYPHTCRLCNAKCITEDHFRAHYNGQRHNAAVREGKQPAHTPIAVNSTFKETKGAAQPQAVWGLKQPSQTQQAASVATPPSPSIPIGASLHACGVCNIQCGTEIVLRSHFNGKKHAKRWK